MRKSVHFSLGRYFCTNLCQNQKNSMYWISDFWQLHSNLSILKGFGKFYKFEDHIYKFFSKETKAKPATQPNQTKVKPRNCNCIIFLIYFTECFQKPGRSEDKIMGAVSKRRMRHVCNLCYVWIAVIKGNTYFSLQIWEVHWLKATYKLIVCWNSYL